MGERSDREDDQREGEPDDQMSDEPWAEQDWKLDDPEDYVDDEDGDGSDGGDADARDAEADDGEPDWAATASENGDSGETAEAKGYRPPDEDEATRDPEDFEGPGWVDDSPNAGTIPEDELSNVTPHESPTPSGSGGGGGGGGTSSTGGGFEPSTAPDDEEMPLTEHVEEMALRFMAVGLVVVGIGAITLFYADELINFLWYSFIGPGRAVCLDGLASVAAGCPQEYRPRIYHPLALVLARLKAATLVGIVAALPVAVYQIYRFMRPGLYPRERRYYLAAVPTSLVLAAVGVGFAYFAILPAMFSYFTTYSEQAADVAFGLTETFNLIVLMIGFFAFVFQIPLLVMLAIMMGVTTRRWLEDRRLYFWGGFGAVAFLFSPDPTGMAPLMVAATMIVLFEGTLLLLRWTASDSPLFAPEAFVARRPYAWALAVAAGYVASTAPVPGSYYDQFPDLVRETLEFNELVTMTPIITAVALILLFEGVAYLVRNFSREVRVWDVVNRLRFPYWMVALVAGYFASPNPPGLESVEALGLPTTEALAVAVGLIIGYELLILGLRWRKNRA